MSIRAQAKKDVQTVTSAGSSINPKICGVNLQESTIHADDRGTLCEIHNKLWEFHSQPVEHVYYVTIRPGKVKGWIYHETYDDRLMVIRGTAKVVLYDQRQDSATEGMVNELYLHECHPTLLNIPSYVVHAVQNVGSEEMMFVNMPTKPYDYQNPDKNRLPLDTKLIPYEFDKKLGW